MSKLVYTKEKNIHIGVGAGMVGRLCDPAGRSGAL